jgi:predicted translation initiation factor SUI1
VRACWSEIDYHALAVSKKQRICTNDDSELRNNPFGSLASALGEVLESAATDATPPAPVERRATPKREGLRGKIVVRREKKGRGGRTATLIEGILLEPAALQELTVRLKKSLACGGTLEGTTIVLTGAQTDRVRTWLQEQGAVRVIVGN